ncbi:MAG: rod shape-determining protein MreC, partial [Coriobacteriales bacterium]|nr:rod shape-determining protein MreC [Coriobacteriales bacterium]
QAGSFISIPFKAISNATNNITASSDDIDALRSQNEELREMVMQLEEYRQENDRLLKLLELSNGYSLEATGARVISRSSDSWNRVLTIDKGSAAGLLIGMPVMSANGLIGQIETVSAFSSVVRLITDEQSGVAVFLQANRVEGIVTGSVEGLLYLKYIPLDVEVVPGDVVITSGAGGVYPKGITIGEVVSADYVAADVYQTIVIKPITRVATYEEVLVLTGNQKEVTLATAAGAGGTGAADAAGENGAVPDAAGQDSDAAQGAQAGGS